MRALKAIAAMAENRVIGDQGRIPWHLPADFRWFKQCTLGQTLVMGRRTFESIGRPLPGRRTIVLSRTWAGHAGVEVVRNLVELEAQIDDVTGEIWVAGGAEVYSLLLPSCGDLFLTRVKRSVPGDTYFPNFEDRFLPVAVVLDEPEFNVVHYQNHNRLLA